MAMMERVLKFVSSRLIIFLFEGDNEVCDAILSGWVTMGPRTKKLEKLIAGYVGVDGVSDMQNWENGADFAPEYK